MESLLFFITKHKTKTNLKDIKYMFRKTVFMVSKIKLVSKQQFIRIKTQSYIAIISFLQKKKLNQIKSQSSPKPTIVIGMNS